MLSVICANCSLFVLNVCEKFIRFFLGTKKKKERRRNESLVFEVDSSTDSIPIGMNEEILGIDFLRKIEKWRVVVLRTHIEFHVLAWVDHSPGMRKITSTDFRIFLSFVRRCRFDGCRIRRRRLHYFCVIVHRSGRSLRARFRFASRFRPIDLGQSNAKWSRWGLNTFVLNQERRTKTRTSENTLRWRAQLCSNQV